MFQSSRKSQSGFGSALTMAELVYHSIVRSIRKQHNNAFVALILNMMQIIMMVFAFYIMFSILGMKGAALRGDFLLYIMSGVFIFMTHVKSMAAITASEGPASPMMQHAPMTTVISIMSVAIGTLYIQILSLFLVLSIYHLAFVQISIDQPFAALGMLLIGWFTGCAVGLVLLAIKPWFPSFVSIFTLLYQRANMIASGKMFVANTLPSYMLSLFDWNPLFHCIDQARGFMFANYTPRYSSWEYAFWVGVILVMIGMMGEFFTRKHASASWDARR